MSLESEEMLISDQRYTNKLGKKAFQTYHSSDTLSKFFSFFFLFFPSQTAENLVTSLSELRANVFIDTLHLSKYDDDKLFLFFIRNNVAGTSISPL